MALDLSQPIMPDTRLTYFLGPGRPYGYASHRMRQLDVYVVANTSKKVKCRFQTAAGVTIERWLSPQNLSFMKWRTGP